MTFLNNFKLNVSLLCLAIVCAAPSTVLAAQTAWNNPNANMAAGSTKPGYAQLSWSKGTVLPIRLRSGMVTMISLPAGEQIDEATVGNKNMFNFETEPGANVMYITPNTDVQGGDTNMIVSGKSGNQYIFYLRAEPTNSSEITYSQVEVVMDGNASLPNAMGAKTVSGGMSSIFKKNTKSSSNTIGVDGEDFGWIKSMKIDPSEFRFDLDIFVPNPDDYVIAPERVWRDRIFTYIDFGDKVIAMTQRPVVSLLVEGGESPVGFRTDGEDGRLLIVEAVGDMVLRSGQRIVCIKKREKPFLIADTNSVMALAEANVAQSMMSGQSLNTMAYGYDMAAINNAGVNYTGTPVMVGNTANTNPAGYYMPAGFVAGQVYPQPTTVGGVKSSGAVTMMPTERVTAGSYLPQSNIPIISSNQTGVAVELKSDTSVKALDEYWVGLLAKFSGENGAGILTPYKDKVFFAVDEQGVGDLGSGATTARLYRLRIGPMADIETAQKLCDQLLKFSGASCSVVRIQ